MRAKSICQLAALGLAIASGTALAAPVKLVATLAPVSGGSGSGTFAVDADAELGDFCYVINVAKVGKVTGAAVQASASPDPVVKLDMQGTNADECVAAEPSALKPIVDNPAGYVVVIKTAEFPAGAVQGTLAKK